jgi:hypothetical protein
MYMIVRGKQCERSRGILQPQLADDVRQVASRLDQNIRRSDLEVEVQPLSNTKVTAAVHLGYRRVEGCGV